jgi:signal transduction histidine kinase
MSERALADSLVRRIGALTWRTLGGYAAIVILGFSALSALSLTRSLTQTASVVESLIGLYADPGGERTQVAPAMLADQLVGIGSRFVITRRTANGDGTRTAYYLTPGMPAKEISGLADGADADALRTAILASITTRRWQYQVMHRQVREFDIFIAADRLPSLLSVAGVALAALILLPVGAALARHATRRAVLDTLGPVEQIRRSIAAIGPDDLSERVPTPTGLSETTEIAATVNQLLARVETSQRALTAFTADASHELRTPITYLRAQAQWALDGSRSDEELREALASVNTEAERMHRLVEGLLLLARGDNNDLAVRHERFDVAPLVAEVAEIAAGMSTAGPTAVAALRVETDVAPGTIAIGDEGHTRQVLLNLVINAVRYTVAGTIRIAASVRDGTVSVAVEDSGVGIAPEQLPRVFERFARAEPSRSREFGGAGLGLAIARMLVELQGGTLNAQSALGKGSRFTLCLPAAPSV